MFSINKFFRTGLGLNPNRLLLPGGFGEQIFIDVLLTKLYLPLLRIDTLFYKSICYFDYNYIGEYDFYIAGKYCSALNLLETLIGFEFVDNLLGSKFLYLKGELPEFIMFFGYR